MTPEWALQLLDQAVSAAPLSRVAHVQCQQAVEVLVAAVQRLKVYVDGDDAKAE